MKVYLEQTATPIGRAEAALTAGSPTSGRAYLRERHQQRDQYEQWSRAPGKDGT